MKKKIIGLEKNWMAVLYAAMGVLMILFPEPITAFAPYMIGISLLVHGVVSIISLCKYKEESGVKLGRIIILLVLGCATLCRSSDSLGPIGATWAMISLYEVAEELTEMYENRKPSMIRIIFSAISIGLAVLLLFNPFQHFVVHVRILGLEMLNFVFIRKHNLKQAGDR